MGNLGLSQICVIKQKHSSTIQYSNKIFIEFHNGPKSKHFLDEEKQIVSIKVTFVRYQNLYVYPKYYKHFWDLVCSKMKIMD